MYRTYSHILPLQVYAFAKPFDYATWILILVTLLASIIFIQLMSSVLSFVESPLFSIETSALYVTSVAMMESYPYTFHLRGAAMRAGATFVLLGLFVVSKASGNQSLLLRVSEQQQ